MKKFSSNRNYAKQAFAFPCHFSIRNSIDKKRHIRLLPETVLQIYLVRMLDTDVNLYFKWYQFNYTESQLLCFKGYVAFNF